MCFAEQASCSVVPDKSILGEALPLVWQNLLLRLDIGGGKACCQRSYAR